MSRTRHVLLLIPVAVLLIACGAEAWERDPQVQAAREACKGLDAVEDYACIERHAVKTLNPDVCRLLGIAIDDMCLQAVYEAADDPAICERIYLQGVQPTCRAYYAQAAPSQILPTEALAHQQTTLPPTPATPVTVTLTDTPTHPSDTKPVVASKGMIVFVDPHGHLCLIEPDGHNRVQLTTGGEAIAPAWSPDGGTLAYIYQEGAAEPRRATLYELGTRRRHTIGVSDQALRSIAWSPNGRHLLLDSGTSMAGRIAIVEVAIGRITHELVAAGYAWSPDGQRLALGQLEPLEDPIPIESGDSVSLAILDISAETPHVVFQGTSEVLYYPRSWLSDGRLLYDRLDWDEDAGTGKHSQWTVTLDGFAGTPEPAANIPPAFDRDATLAGLPEAFQNAETGSFSWSPDGQWLAFRAGAGRRMGIYLFDWAHDGEPLHLVDGTSPAWQPVPVQAPATRPADLPTAIPRQPEVVSEGRLACTPLNTFSRCVDELLNIEFEVPTSWGAIETRLTTGGYAGFAYHYFFGGKTHAETEPLVAGGRSADFAEGRGAMSTDFLGHGHRGWQRTSVCDSPGTDSFPNSFPICRQVSDSVAWMLRFPNASVLCEDVLGNWQTMPVFRVEVNLPNNPTVNGFVFEAPFFSEQFAGRVEHDLYPLLGARLNERASKCDEASRQAFDAQLMALIESITDRTADAETLEKVNELVHLAESIVVAEQVPVPLEEPSPDPAHSSPGLAVEEAQALLDDYSRALSSGQEVHEEFYTHMMQALVEERRGYYRQFHEVALHSSLLGIGSRYTLESIAPDAEDGSLVHVRAVEWLTTTGRYLEPRPEEYAPTRATLWALARTNHLGVQKALQDLIDRQMRKYLARLNLGRSYETVWILRHHLLVRQAADRFVLVQDAYDDKANDNEDGTDVVEWVDGRFVRHRPDLTLWPDYEMYHEPLEVIEAEGRRLLSSYTRRYGGTPAPDLHPGWLTYTHPIYAFSFRYPPGWQVDALPKRPHFVRVRPQAGPDVELTVGVRGPDEDASIQRTGVGAGDVETQGSVRFLGREVAREVLVYEGKVKAVLYNNAVEMDVDGLIFTLSLDGRDADYASDIGPDVQSVVNKIVGSFLLSAREPGS